ncbi:hypothetical protein PRZ48_003368 [Zasmidium cellare]|uniref:Uncharacterized protein n=1 Tax=Zasmidium cellare TaxID=395010 RepID=A0ABR0EVW2_ZASCE|nr:hypothetical protein PRZ48_003368 [Zasmidium cellare]
MGERWQFRLCGTMMHMRLECTNTINNAEALHDELADGFNAEEGSQPTFHFSDEDCSSRRPLQEPGNLPPANRSIQIHFDRPATTTVPWTAKLFFKFEADVKGYDMDVWKSRFMPISLTDTLDTVRDRVKKQINFKLRRQQRLGSQYRLRPESDNKTAAASSNSTSSQRHAVRFGFGTAICSLSSATNNKALDLDAGDSYLNRVRQLIDLFEHPVAFTGEDLEIVAYISASWRDPKSEEDIVERINPKSTDALYVRVGDTGDESGEDDEVPVEHALLARLGENKEVLDVRELHAWNFGNFCIADITKADVVDFPADNFKLLPSFSGARTLAELGQLLRSTDTTTSRVPILPSISLNSSKAPTPARMPEDDDEATIAVRLVSHLPAEATQDVNLEDQNCSLWLNNDDSAATAEQYIVEWMRNSEDEGRHVLRPIFFEGPLKDTWKCELWVMPQNSTSFTLFRFDEQNTGFSDFLDQAHVDAGDLKVYMECHIWPKDTDTVTGL